MPGEEGLRIGGPYYESQCIKTTTSMNCKSHHVPCNGVIRSFGVNLEFMMDPMFWASQTPGLMKIDLFCYNLRVWDLG